MNLDSLITILGLLVAVYAIIPRVRRLEILLKFGLFGWVVTICSLFSVMYLQFYQSFSSIGFTPGFHLSRWAITPENASFLIILVMAIILWGYISIRGLSRSNIVKFREFVFELVREKRYSELFSFLEKHLEQLSRIYIGRSLSHKLKGYFEEKYRDSLMYSIECDENGAYKINNVKATSWLEKNRLRFYNEMSSRIHEYQAPETANEIVSGILLDHNIVRVIAAERPFLALRILDKPFYQKDDFFDCYMRALVKDTRSVLYHEVRNNQNLQNHCEYDIPKSNRLLHYLFNNCSVAEELGAYKPVGDYVIKILDELNDSPHSDQYNKPMGEFAEKGQWESELLLGINFFDIMVTSALHQNIKWHMWLYYYSYFVEKIIKNMTSMDSFTDQPIEWPSRYHFAIYRMISNLCKWIDAVKYLPSDQENIQLDSERPDNENGNIPKSCMIALGEITKNLLVSGKLDERFQQYIMDIIYRTYFELIKSQETSHYAQAFINSIQSGGHYMLDTPEFYKDQLFKRFKGFDCIPYIEFSSKLESLLLEGVEGKRER